MVNLPTPPNDFENDLYLDQNKRGLYFFGVLAFLLLQAAMVLFSLSHPALYFYLVFAALNFFYLSVSYGIGIFGKSFDLGAHKRIVDSGSDFLPTIDVYLPCCGEPIEVIENTYWYVNQLRWDHDKINVYVLDDGDSSEVAELAKEFGFNYWVRPDKGVLKKAGNLRHAFARTSGDLILILDADFCPRPDMLSEMVPYFKDESVAIVQSPQYFSVKKEQSWVERGAGYVQELFYRLIQVNRNTWGGSICVGTCAVYRREALEPFGGTAAIAYSEDLHTGFNVVKAGGRVVYIPINLSKGICPDTLPAYFSQQYRWAMGSTSLCFGKEFWTVKIGAKIRLCYLSGMMYYMATAAGIFITPIPGMLMVWFRHDHVFWYNMLFSLPSFIYGTVYMAFWGRAKFGWYAPKARLVAYYAHVFAVLDRIMNTTMPWVPSGASMTGSVGRYRAFKNLIFWWSTLSSGLILAGAFHHMDSVLDYNFYPMIFFNGFNYWISMSVLRDQLVE